MKIQEKQCSTCYKIKPLCDFEWRKDTNKIRAQCKECRITKAKEYSINNRKKRIDYAKEYYIKNINKVKERHKQYYIENKNTILEKSRRWKKDNKKTVKERSKVYSVKNKLNIRHNSRKFYLNNKSRILNKQKERYLNDNDFRIAVKKRQRLWVIINRDRINSLSRIRSKIKRRENQAYKLRGNISSAVRSALKKLGGSKGGKSTFQYLPYTVKELKEHLEKQFESWMNWNNW